MKKSEMVRHAIECIINESALRGVSDSDFETLAYLFAQYGVEKYDEDTVNK